MYMDAVGSLEDGHFDLQVVVRKKWPPQCPKATVVRVQAGTVLEEEFRREGRWGGNKSATAE
jgi:hypothetical protein